MGYDVVKRVKVVLGSGFGVLGGGIVRPVKRDWAVLSKDTPMDISILKSVRHGVFIHLRNALHLYTCIYL